MNIRNTRNKNKQMSETIILGMMLACVGGFLDAYTYICRGGIFANAQTGNLVLLGIRIAEGNLIGSLKYLIPIIAFVLGILIAEIVRKRHKNSVRIHWRQIIIVVELFVLLGITFIPNGGWYDMIANVLVSFVCSLQVQSFRKFNGNAMATTMCTGNLRSATEYFYNYLDNKDRSELHRSFQYLAIIIVFIIGAAIGAIASIILGVKAIILSCIVLSIVFLLMLINNQ